MPLMNRINKINVKPAEWIHLTCNSGLRVRADDPRCGDVGAMALPFLVIESIDGFQPLWGEKELRLVRSEAGLEIEGGSAQLGGIPHVRIAQNIDPLSLDALRKKSVRPKFSRVTAHARRNQDITALKS